uniref:Uncharacterized protein n=1 Tax=Anguilla anguilla TaxID=7936 RepID=A0A0E9TQ24_ANGAN
MRKGVGTKNTCVVIFKSRSINNYKVEYLLKFTKDVLL